LPKHVLRARARSRFGFTLIEVAVSAAIVALLAAVTTPYLMGYLDKQRAQPTADQLSSLAAGIAAFGRAVRTAAAATSSSYPGLLSELTSQIPLNSTTWHNSCTSLVTTGGFNATATAAWSNNGPFLSFMVPQGGLNTPLGFVQDSMVRSSSAAVAGTLAIRMTGVDTADANLLDRIVDGGDGSSAGTLRMVNASGATVEIQYLVPVGAHC